MEKLNRKIEILTLNLSDHLFLLKTDDKKYFFQIDNSDGPFGNSVNVIKQKLIASLRSGLVETGFSVRTVWVLFLDNCREENNYMNVKNFREKGFSSNFTAEDCNLMVEVYMRAGIIFFQPELNLPDNEKYIFFAPSFLAQALGSFIRDPSFHQLAFRLDKDNFPFYRKYIDTGKINKSLFNLLLKEYSEKERNYVLTVALEHFVLFRVEKEIDIFIVPELLPPIDNKIKPTSKSDILLIHNNYWTISDFVKVFNWFLKDENEILETLLFKGFARFIFSTKKIVDIYLKSDKKLSIKLVQGNNYIWLRDFSAKLMDEKSASFLNIILLCKREKSGITLENAQNEHWIDYFSNNTVEENLFDRFFSY
eukprot:snap_masked-scaffold_99-processed-gene-0.11-mRNA-1 protein AED:1.00 eAED:1.00 QI:0/-1/0/0/-1/1/1/0/365